MAAIRWRLDILKEIDSIVDATHTHILKPDSRAYELGCEALGLSPEQVLFVDDQPGNVEAPAAPDWMYYGSSLHVPSIASPKRRGGSDWEDHVS